MGCSSAKILSFMSDAITSITPASRDSGMPSAPSLFSEGWIDSDSQKPSNGLQKQIIVNETRAFGSDQEDC